MNMVIVASGACATAVPGKRILLGIGFEFGLAAGAAEQQFAGSMNAPVRSVGRYGHSAYGIAQLGSLNCLLT
jgi:hypothetical protein